MRRLTVAGSRFYEVPGRDRLYPSVTTLLGVISKKFLNRWETKLALEKFRERVDARLAASPSPITSAEFDAWIAEAHLEPSAVLTAAGTFGSDAHTLFESLAKGDAVHVPETHRVVVDNFHDWRLRTPGLSIVHTELVLYSDRHVYAGTADAVARTPEGKLVVLDWKTGNSIHMEAALQVAAYAKAYEEMHGEPVAEAWVVRFDKHRRKPAQVRVVAESNMARVYRTFLQAAQLWQSVQGDVWDKAVKTSVGNIGTVDDENPAKQVTAKSATEAASVEDKAEEPRVRAKAAGMTLPPLKYHF